MLNTLLLLATCSIAVTCPISGMLVGISRKAGAKEVRTSVIVCVCVFVWFFVCVYVSYNTNQMRVRKESCETA